MKTWIFLKPPCKNRMLLTDDGFNSLPLSSKIWSQRLNVFSCTRGWDAKNINLVDQGRELGTVWTPPQVLFTSKFKHTYAVVKGCRERPGYCQTTRSRPKYTILTYDCYGHWELCRDESPNRSLCCKIVRHSCELSKLGLLSAWLMSISLGNIMFAK